MKKIYSFFKNNLALLFVVFILIIIAFIIGFIDGWKWSDYTSGVFTEIIGIIITVIFVDVLFNNSQEKNARELEKKKILRICRLIDLYLERYIIYFNQLTNHPGNIFDCEIMELRNSPGILIHSSNNCMMVMNNNQNMFYKTDEYINYIHFSCLYEFSRLFISGGFRLNIDCFYYFEKRIKKAFIRLLTEVNFEYNKDMEKIVLKYLDTSISNDVSDFIENNKKVVYEDNSKKRKLKIESDTKTLASRNFNESQDFDNSHRGLQPYQMLKTMLNEERDILHQYIKIINKLKNK
jgi:hypothetical protein